MSLEKQTIIIIAVSSDIGGHLARDYLQRGYRVYGTYRSLTPEVLKLQSDGVILFPLDVSSIDAVHDFTVALSHARVSWDVLISAPGVLSPIGPFFGLDFEKWACTVSANSIAQLRILHAIYPLRTKHQLAKAIFFAGGGTNGVFDNYSAYCIGKLILIKMTELLDSEYSDLQISIIGTGWVNTKIHKQTLAAGAAAGVNFEKTRSFLESDQEQSTTIDSIVECIDWCLNSPRSAVGGRNFSLVSDRWRDEDFIEKLEQESGTYKLRRHV